jgi:hypothetical protein
LDVLLLSVICSVCVVWVLRQGKLMEKAVHGEATTANQQSRALACVLNESFTKQGVCMFLMLGIQPPPPLPFLTIESYSLSCAGVFGDTAGAPKEGHPPHPAQLLMSPPHPHPMRLSRLAAAILRHLV